MIKRRAAALGPSACASNGPGSAARVAPRTARAAGLPARAGLSRTRHRAVADAVKPGDGRRSSAPSARHRCLPPVRRAGPAAQGASSSGAGAWGGARSVAENEILAHPRGAWERDD